MWLCPSTYSVSTLTSFEIFILYIFFLLSFLSFHWLYFHPIKKQTLNLKQWKSPGFSENSLFPLQNCSTKWNQWSNFVGEIVTFHYFRFRVKYIGRWNTRVSESVLPNFTAWSFYTQLTFLLVRISDQSHFWIAQLESGPKHTQHEVISNSYQDNRG